MGSEVQRPDSVGHQSHTEARQLLGLTEKAGVKVELDVLVVALIFDDPGREESGGMMVETLQGQLAQVTGKAVGWASTDKVQGRDPVSSVWGCV